jgi:lysophospholipid acyltransferase (LPLAT)-like uncharacterized protein
LPVAARDRKRRGPVRRTLRRLRRAERWSALEVRVLGVLTWMVLLVLRRTTRLRLVGMEPLEQRWARGEPSVLAFWHGRSIMLPFLYSGPGASIMNSTHRDGEIITRALARFGIRSTRGSSSRSAVAGTLGLMRELRSGRDVALIPDGPRGPAGAAKAGAVSLAAAARVPLFPLAFSARPSIRLGGWDRMMIPLPGAAVVCVVGAPLVRDGARSGRALRDDARLEVEKRLREVTRHADRLAGRSEEDR